MKGLPTTSTPAIPASGEIDPARGASPRSYLCCIAGNSQLCLPLAAVIRVFAMVSLQPVPRGPSFLKGLVNVGGASLPVIDLAEKVGLPPEARYSLDTSIVMCGTRERRAGIIVESVAGLAWVSPADMQLEGIFDRGGNCLAGVAVIQGRQSLIVDIDLLLDFDLSTEAGAPAWPR